MLMRKEVVPPEPWRSKAIAVISFFSVFARGLFCRSGVYFAAHDPREERIAKSLQRLGRDRVPNTSHQVKVKRNIMDGVIDHCRYFAVHVEMPQVGAGDRPAGHAGAVGVERTLIGGVPRVLDRHLAEA